VSDRLPATQIEKTLEISFFLFFFFFLLFFFFFFCSRKNTKMFKRLFGKGARAAVDASVDGADPSATDAVGGDADAGGDGGTTAAAAAHGGGMLASATSRLRRRPIVLRVRLDSDRFVLPVRGDVTIGQLRTAILVRYAEVRPGALGDSAVIGRITDVSGYELDDFLSVTDAVVGASRGEGEICAIVERDDAETEGPGPAGNVRSAGGGDGVTGGARRAAGGSASAPQHAHLSRGARVVELDIEDEALAVYKYRGGPIPPFPGQYIGFDLVRPALAAFANAVRRSRVDSAPMPLVVLGASRTGRSAVLKTLLPSYVALLANQNHRQAAAQAQNQHPGQQPGQQHGQQQGQQQGQDQPNQRHQPGPVNAGGTGGSVDLGSVVYLAVDCASLPSDCGPAACSSELVALIRSAARDAGFRLATPDPSTTSVLAAARSLIAALDDAPHATVILLDDADRAVEAGCGSLLLAIAQLPRARGRVHLAISLDRLCAFAACIDGRPSDPVPWLLANSVRVALPSRYAEVYLRLAAASLAGSFGLSRAAAAAVADPVTLGTPAAMASCVDRFKLERMVGPTAHELQAASIARCALDSAREGSVTRVISRITEAHVAAQCFPAHTRVVLGAMLQLCAGLPLAQAALLPNAPVLRASVLSPGTEPGAVRYDDEIAMHVLAHAVHGLAATETGGSSLCVVGGGGGRGLLRWMSLFVLRIFFFFFYFFFL
jgi:hypothetical protein